LLALKSSSRLLKIDGYGVVLAVFSSWMLLVEWKERLSRWLSLRFLAWRTHVGPGYTSATAASQISHAHQIVGRAGEGENPRHFAHSAVPHFAQPATVLQPAETFFGCVSACAD